MGGPIGAADATDASDVEEALGQLLAWAKDRPAREGLDLLRNWRDRIEVCRAEIIAAQKAAGANDKQLDRMMGLGTTSHGERKRAKERAETIERNGDLAKDVESGDLTMEQLDAVATADTKSDGQAANDPELLAEIAESTADTARRVADRWLKKRDDNADREDRRRRQRNRREARKGQTSDGLSSLTIAGDDESVAEMWAAIVQSANAMYTADGGRDLPGRSHPRSNAQRLFDAAHHYLTNPSGAPGGASAAATIVVTANKLAGRDHTPAEMIGSGPIPDTLLHELACNGAFVGMLFGGEGEVLWQGRRRRYPTKAQMLALIARDKGCVLCGAQPQLCQAHHVMPWSAPGQGKTDVDGLALMCQRHHRELHEDNRTLYRERATGRWRSRPATSRETPKARPPNRPRPASGPKPATANNTSGSSSRRHIRQAHQTHQTQHSDQAPAERQD